MNRLKLKDKRGISLGDMYPAVLTIVLIGIVLGVGIYVLSETADAISNTLITVTNETAINASGGTSVATVTNCGASDFLAVEVNNGTAIPSTNYTFSSEGLLTDTSEVAQEQLWNITYTYRGGDTSTTGYCGVLDTSSTGIGGFASWIAVIVVVLAAAIVLGIVIDSFGRNSSV